MAMLKIALPVVLLCTLSLFGQTSQPPSQGTGKETSQDGNTQGQGKQTHSGPPLQGTEASPLWVKVIQAGTDKPNSPPDEEKSKTSPPSKRRSGPNWWVAVFTVVLAVIAAIQAGLFYWQLGLLKESLIDAKAAADAARDAANAAMQSADIATNSERAWVVTDATFSSDWPDLMKKGAPDKSKVILKIKNAGRSPAELEQVEILAFVYPANDDFPNEPVYGDGSKGSLGLDLMPGEIIQAGEDRVMICSIQNFEILEDVEIGRLRRRETRLYCYGRLNYKDISGSLRSD
jgi:hypothetical protein